MHPVPKNCPICGSELTITALHCPSCDTTIEGRFAHGSFANLTPEQWDFVEMFIRFEGKLKHMGAELNLSYPTVRNRLHEIIRALGYEPGRQETPVLDSAQRQAILDRLDRGEITAEEAMRLLSGEEA